MSTPYVTIGGKEVDLTPGDAAHRRAFASAGADSADAKNPANPGRVTAMVSLMVVLSLLTLIVTWRINQRGH